MIARRALLKSALSLAAGPAVYTELSKPARAAASAGQMPAGNGPPQAFDFAWLKGQAHYLASNVYQESKDILPPSMAKLGYDQYQSIRFRNDHSLWGEAGFAFRLQFFHVGRTFNQPVHLYEVVDGQAREILYDPVMFEWDKSGIDPASMKDRAGFAVFRVKFAPSGRPDVAVFGGAIFSRGGGGDPRQ